MVVLLLTCLVGFVATCDAFCNCDRVETIDRTVREAYCNQPLFFNFVPDTEENKLLDNVCNTFFPLPDDPDTFQAYQARVFCDGSSDVTSSIVTQISLGVDRIATPFFTVTDSVIGYAGCDTYIVYRCANYGGCFEPYVYGLSSNCRALGLSCLRKVEEIIEDRGLQPDSYYVLPQKLPNRCVTQQLCLLPPNPFYNVLPGAFVV